MLRLPKNKVAIAPLFDRDKSKGGIIIPDKAKSRSVQGFVKYVGPDVKDIKPGDYVIFGAYDGTTVQMEFEGTLVFMDDTAIRCTVKDPVTDVAGLYFYDHAGWAGVIKYIEDQLDAKMYLANTRDQIIGFVKEALSSSHNPYFPANYEMIVDLLCQTADDEALQDRIDTKNNKHWQDADRKDAQENLNAHAR